MNEENIKSIIALQRINNNLLALIDSMKAQNDINLKLMLDTLYAPYEKVEPNFRNQHHFLNQYQLISSLYIYIVLPKESFLNSIPNEIESSSLKDGCFLQLKIDPPLQPKIDHPYKKNKA